MAFSYKGGRVETAFLFIELDYRLSFKSINGNLSCQIKIKTRVAWHATVMMKQELRAHMALVTR